MVINRSDSNQGVNFILKESECEMVQLKVEESHILIGGGTVIKTGAISWFNVPYPANTMLYICIFCLNLEGLLLLENCYWR